MPSQKPPQEQPNFPGDISSTTGILALIDSDPATLGQAGLQKRELHGTRAHLDLTKLTPIEEQNGVSIMGLLEAGSQTVKIVATHGSNGELQTNAIFLAAGDEDVSRKADSKNPMLRAISIQPGEGLSVFGRNRPGAGRLGLGKSTVSQDHFSIELDQEGRLSVQDLNSLNGTRLITRAEPEKRARASRVLSVAKRAGTALVRARTRAKSDRSHAVAQPEKPTAGLPSYYESPPDQMSFEMNLVDSYRQRFPESITILEQALGGIQSVTSELNPNSESGASNMVLKMPAGLTKAELDSMSENARAAAWASAQGVELTADGELPSETQALVEGIYALTGAQVLDLPDGFISKLPTFDYVLRRGVYQGKEIYFEELYRHDGSPDRNKIGFNLAVLGQRSNLIQAG
jgi:hypothetical protein